MEERREEKEEGEEESEEEGEGEKEEAEAVLEAAEEEAAGGQEEAAVELQGSATLAASPEKVVTTPQNNLLGTFLEILQDAGSKQSLQSYGSGTSELVRGLDSNSENVSLDQVCCDKQQIGSSGELGKRSYYAAQDKQRQEGRDLDQKQGGKRRERGKAKLGKGISYLLGDDEMELQARAGASGESLVSSSTEDTLFQKDEGAQMYPLALSWSFGWNSSLPVFYIRERSQRVLLYVCGHTAVIYDVPRNTQRHLQGHPNVISCLCVSEDRRWIATADKGPGCLIIIWDSFTSIPVHTIFDSCPQGSGVRAIAITRDAKYLATISDAEVQQVCIWRWTLAVETPGCALELPPEYGFQVSAGTLGGWPEVTW